LEELGGAEDSTEEEGFPEVSDALELIDGLDELGA
jgi:hypothetical protein